ncbi:MMPL family transporter [Yinghuangia sp. ASG 101]|uniref:MMPL family transporter n=1 Tax=Yinghuangia sp. ASG 101 TaxID=2896848 RepID=UPI001E578D07|nr:MMPL family transporter [Yinghuangia sp. ASG 101]UGQ12433.1 MMPL family transporter [Yinghuangia sp. ASG 101]
MLDSAPTGRAESDRSSESPRERGALAYIAYYCVRRRRQLLVGAVIMVLAAGMVVAAARDQWSNGGFTTKSGAAADAEKAAARLGADSADLILYVRADAPVDDAAVADQGRRLTETIAGRTGVTAARSYWTTGSPLLRARDGRGALISVDLAGTERDTVATARDLVPAAREASGALTVSATGPAWTNAQATAQSEHDLKRGELLAAPLTLLILLLAFGSLTAAALPIAIGAVSVAGALAALAALTHVLPISVFAINICASLGFALAVDYALFVVTRYREEIAAGTDATRAIARSMAKAGHAVLFSAATVALCLSALFVFPLELLRSLACASMLVVAISAVTTVFLLPALLAVLGPRLDRLDPFRRLRRKARTRPEGGGSPLWHRIASVSTARPIVTGGIAVLLLLLLATPFTNARFHIVDEKILPSASEAHRTADSLRTDFADPPERVIPVILPDTHPAADAAAIDAYARRLSLLPQVVHVLADTGDYRAGAPVPGTQPTAAAATPRAGTVVRVVSAANSQAPQTVALVHEVRDLPAPGPHLVAGKAAELSDTKHALRHALPYGAAIVVLGTLVMLFMFTRSVLVPVKAVLMGLLSLTATLGALVFVFQDGHLRSVVGDFTTSGSLEATMPLLTLAIGFGISVDYEVFLIARIKEEYERTGDNTRAIVFGIEHTGRLFTAAALIVAAGMVALSLSHVTLLKMVGVGLAVAVVVDATLVRGILVPSLMRLTGRANWWAPSFPWRIVHRDVLVNAKLPDARAEITPAVAGPKATAVPEAPEETVS